MKESWIATMATAVFLLLASSVVSPKCSFGENSADALRKAREACDVRLQKAGTIKISWTTEELRRKGSMTGGLASTGKASPGVDYPPRDVRELSKCRIILHGKSWRYDRTGRTWTPVTNDVTRDLDTSSVFHENRYRKLSRLARSGLIGVKNEIKPDIDVEAILAPFMLPSFNTGDTVVTVLRSQKTVAGEETIVLGNTDYNRPGVFGATRAELTLDVTRGFVPLKKALMYPDGRLLVECQITYRQHPLAGYVPDVITINLMDIAEQKVTTVRTLSVKEVAFGETISDSIFDLPFPPDTRVNDRVSGRTFIASESPAKTGDNSVPKASKEAAPLALKQGETPGEVVIPLRGNSPFRISGVVLDPEGKPVAGVIPRLGGLGTQTDVRTDKAGEFSLEIDPRTVLGITEDMSIYALVPERNLAAMAPLESGKKEIHLTLRLQSGGIVTGRVLDEEKKPLAKARMQLKRAIRDGTGGTLIMGFGHSVPANTDGRFRIPCLCEGAEYWLNTTAENYGREEAREIKPAAGQAIDLGDIILLPADVYVDVLVVDSFGNPVGGAHLFAQGEKQPDHNPGSTVDKNGRIRLGPFVASSLLISASQTGYCSASARLTLTKGKNEQVTIEIINVKGASTRLSTGTTAPKLEGVDWLAGKGDLVELKGKPVALVFFAPGNRSSMAALNRLQALQKELGEDKLAFVAVCDASVTAEELKKLWSDKGFPFALGRVADGDRQGWTSPAFRAYEVRALPGIILINPESRIHQRDVSISDLEKAVRSLVGAK